jgi:hypothetical protein
MSWCFLPYSILLKKREREHQMFCPAWRSEANHNTFMRYARRVWEIQNNRNTDYALRKSASCAIQIKYAANLKSTFLSLSHCSVAFKINRGPRNWCPCRLQPLHNDIKTILRSIWTHRNSYYDALSFNIHYRDWVCACAFSLSKLLNEASYKFAKHHPSCEALHLDNFYYSVESLEIYQSHINNSHINNSHMNNCNLPMTTRMCRVFAHSFFVQISWRLLNVGRCLKCRIFAYFY